MGSVSISYLGIVLLFASGWLVGGWPVYLFTKYTHGDISYRFTLKAAIIGIFIGICLIGIALQLPFFVISFISIFGSLGAFIGIIVGLRKNV